MYDLALAIFAALAFCPLFFWPTCACCGTVCPQCSAGTPQQFQVDVTGFANDTCTDCANIDGTWILAIGNNCLGVTGTCAWHYDASGPLCGDVFCMDVIVSQVPFSSDRQVRYAAVVGVVAIVEFIKTYTGTRPDCESLSSTDLPFSSNLQTNCDGSGATVLITAL